MTQLKQYKHETAMTNDTTWTGAIPAGYQLEQVILVNSTANQAILDLGTSSGGSQVFLNQIVAANDITIIDLNEVFSMTARQTLYLNDSDASSSWNSASLIALLNMRRSFL